MNLAAHPTRPPRPSPVVTWSITLEEADAIQCVAVPYPITHITSSGLQICPFEIPRKAVADRDRDQKIESLAADCKGRKLSLYRGDTKHFAMCCRCFSSCDAM